MVEGGTAHGYGTITKINLCVHGVPPTPVYKGAEEGRAGPLLWRALGESYSHRE